MLLRGCSEPALMSDQRVAEPLAPHIVLLIADDLGLDVAPCHSDASPMPALTARCDESVVFERAYAHPVCTASRAALVTGRHPFRTGAGDVRESSDKLALSEVTFPEYISAHGGEGYRFGAFGKWHLASDSNGSERNPNLQGFDHFEGTPRQHDTYDRYRYNWTRNGEDLGPQTTYKTTRIVDAVIEDFTVNRSNAPQVYMVGFVNPHLPYQVPPAALHTQGDLKEVALKPVRSDTPGPGEYRMNRREPHFDKIYVSMLEALDTEIDRLVRHFDEHTDRPILYFFLSDNGSAAEVYRGNTRGGYRAKASLYDGGVRVPLQVWSGGPPGHRSIQPGRTRAMVQISDLFATLAALTGVDSAQIADDTLDFSAVLFGASKEGPRRSVYIERGNLDRSPFAYGLVDSSGHKLILRDPDRKTGYADDELMEFYDTHSDPGETRNLFKTNCHADFARSHRLLDEMIALHVSEPENQTTFSPDPYLDELEQLIEACKVQND